MTAPEADVLVRLPDAHREAFKAPLGPIETDPKALLARLEGPLVTVGDVVSYHVYEAGGMPAVAVLDGRTHRQSVDPAIESALAAVDVPRIEATNPPGTVTRSLLRALQAAIERDEPVQVHVDGEEDLAAVPAILLAPTGAHVVYGQPGEGMVHVDVTAEARARAMELVDYFEGETEAVRSLVSL